MKEKRQRPWKRVLLGCLAALLALAAGCSPAQASKGLLSGQELASWEKLYGQPLEAVRETLGLEEDQVAQGTGAGQWETQEERLLGDESFAMSLLTVRDTGELYGLWYTFFSQDPAQLFETAQSVLAEAQRLYGEPTTYPGLENRLSELEQDAWEETAASGTLEDWREEWAVGETTLCTLTLNVLGEDRGSLVVEYKQAA